MKSLLDRGIELNEYQLHMLNTSITRQCPRGSGKTFMSFVKAMNYVEQRNQHAITIDNGSYLMRADPDVRVYSDVERWLDKFTLFVKQYYHEYTVTRGVSTITLSRALIIWET